MCKDCNRGSDDDHVRLVKKIVCYRSPVTVDEENVTELSKEPIKGLQPQSSVTKDQRQYRTATYGLWLCYSFCDRSERLKQPLLPPIVTTNLEKGFEIKWHWMTETLVQAPKLLFSAVR